MQVAVSPCWEKDLPDVIAAPLSLRAWTPTPVALEVLLPVSSPKTSAFPSFGPGRRSTMYRTATSVRRAFRGCSHFLMFRPTGVLATQIAPTDTARRMAAVTFPSEPLVVCYLPTPRICLPSESGN